ncbi:unnamed protein product [Fructobacillus fructosus]|uniref:hypothetical protein n=1 Tax=Fructobacillus fructosus TaxID=1631 RepID=UPI00021955F9|nr:hypothetical protein [Fructobacillus fructosus]GAP01337.1 transcriptional regulator, LysR family [Fructobacillus fructosus]CAK1245124.1 unnamed protein product [Fructobacillus fructosus]
MKITELKLRRRDYWLSLQAVEREEGGPSFMVETTTTDEEEPVLDYRVLCFSYEDYLVIDWTKAFPGPNPLSLIASRLQDQDLTDLQKEHGIISFKTKGVRDRATYLVTINTVRS